MRLLTITPIEPFKISLTPTLPSTTITMRIDRGIGIPLPSTILGLVGALLNIRLDKNDVLKDPLLGLGVLVEKLSSRYSGSEGDSPVITGPLLDIEGRIALPVYSKAHGAIYVDEQAISNINTDNPWISLCNIAGILSTKILQKIKLADETLTNPRVTTPGGAYRTSISWITKVTARKSDQGTCVIDKEKTPTKYSINYATGLDNADLGGIVKLGGESRLATVEMHSLPPTLQDKLTPLCEAQKGYYMALSPIALLPKKVTNYYRPEDFHEPDIEVIGIPPLLHEPSDTTQLPQPKTRVLRLGLGYSNVAGTRRPQILALPPGTIIKISNSVNCRLIQAKLCLD